MPTYEVFLKFIGTTVIVVKTEDEDEDEAIEKAFDEAPQNNFAHSEYDVEEWTLDESYDGGVRKIDD